MRVTRLHIDALLIKVAHTREQEANCDDCARQAARLVDAVRRGDVRDQELLDILHHLVECIPCSQEFQILEDCARMDDEDSWPSFEEIWNKFVQGQDSLSA